MSGLWDKAPYMEEISPESFRKFYDHVSSEFYIALRMSPKYIEVYTIGICYLSKFIPIRERVTYSAL